MTQDAAKVRRRCTGRVSIGMGLFERCVRSARHRGPCCQHYVRTNAPGFPCEDCGDLVDGDPS